MILDLKYIPDEANVIVVSTNHIKDGVIDLKNLNYIGTAKNCNIKELDGKYMVRVRLAGYSPYEETSAKKIIPALNIDMFYKTAELKELK